jgi:hypothetical protein
MSNLNQNAPAAPAQVIAPRAPSARFAARRASWLCAPREPLARLFDRH